MAEQDTVRLQDFDGYITRLFAPEDAALVDARALMRKENLPHIYVSPSEGKLLHMLAKISGAKWILEIGTLGGYSAIWLARALPADGRLITLEIDPHHADVSRRNIAHAGLADKVEVRVGPALESLAAMPITADERFDLVFIDADKEGYPEYLKKVVPLTRSGGLILADNAMKASVLDQAADSGIARYNAAASAHPELESILVPVVRDEIDGLLISRKK